MGTYEQTKVLRSTTQWAQKECIKWINEHVGCPKQLAVELFIAKMDEYSTKAKSNSAIFSIARDVGMMFLDEMIRKGEAR
jgi:hypothetical protein